MNPLIPAMMSQGMSQGGDNSLSDFLDDFNELFDTEWPFLLALVVCCFTLLAVVVSSLVVGLPGRIEQGGAPPRATPARVSG